MRGLRGVITAICTVGLFVVPAGSAVAKKKPGKLRTATATISVPAPSAQTAVAVCPGKTRLLGGGFTAAPPHGSAAVSASRRSGKKGWQVTVSNYNAGQPAVQLTAYAYCRRRAPKLSEASAVTPVAGDLLPHSAVAQCPARRFAVAGGFEGELRGGPAGIPPFVTTSVRSGKRAWTVGAYSTNNPDRSLTALAYCAKRRLGARSGPAAPITGDSGVGGASSKPCGKRKRALSGGFQASDPSFIPAANVVIPYESRRSGKTWLTSGIHFGAATTATLTSIAYCGR